MESVHILVVDRTPETAQHINSLLRNSGIKVHVNYVHSYAEAKSELDDVVPVLILYGEPESVDAGLEETMKLAHEHGISCAIYGDLEHPERVVDLLKSNACLVIDSNNPDLLISAVSGLLDRHASDRNSQTQIAQLDELEHRFDLLMESARDAIAYIHEGLHVSANRAYLNALHLSESAELDGLSLLEVMSIPDGNFKNVLRDVAAHRFPPEDVKVDVCRPDGTKFEATLSFSSATFDGEPCIQMILQEKDQASELAAELERMRITDPLTELANRAGFLLHLNNYLGEEIPDSAASAVLYIEPDGLGSEKSGLGLAAVDAHVSALARVVREYLEDGDFAGRVTDHGIAILICRENKQQIEAFARAIHVAFSSVIVEFNGQSSAAACTVGLVKLSRLATDGETIVSHARTAHAEGIAGAEEICMFRPPLTPVALAEDENLWLSRIRLALRQDNFYTEQESIVDLDGEGEHLLENKVCLRVEDEEFQQANFAAAADKHELAGAIDKSVIPQVFRTIANSDEKQIITLSTQSVADPEFPAWLVDHIRIHAVDASKLVIQIPADTAQANMKPTQRIMKELSPQGCKLAISMFGPERRTLQLLDLLKPSFVKLHPSLTTDLAENQGAKDSIREIVEAAAANKASVIADNISDTSNLATLWQCGVKLIAGAFLAETSQVVGQ